MKLIGVKGVQDLLECSRKDAIKILTTKGCPILKRARNESYKVFDEELIEWIKEGGMS